MLWLDGAGKPAAVCDRCCHRSAQLSKGKVVEGNIRCPYHGWSFNADGVCVRVPQLEKSAIPRSYQVSAYHCQERYDYVWVCLGEPFARTLKIHYPNGLIHLIFNAVTPIDDQTSQMVQFCFRNDTEAEAKAEDVIAFDRIVTQEDQQVLETTDYDAPLSIQEEQHMPSDKPGILMRRRLAALLKEHGEVEQRRKD
ncbi:Rieske 2Fe-2S domain-containing protein [Leptothermofonsia sichuanensis]|uniref:Rieske 2Fe-2S domain-containing protein n=1 Tax=Leptothermofonsia sichuanensis TaxID=2917832 RepID=UPI001EF05062